MRASRDPRVVQWYETIFFERLAVGMSERPEPWGHRALLEENHGIAFPPELVRLLDFRDRMSLHWPAVGEWRVWSDDSWVPDPQGNRFEQLVAVDQANVLSTALMEYFASLVVVGSAGNGDVYLAALDPRDPDNCVVGFYDHEAGNLTHLIADSLSSLAWANRALVEAEEEVLDEELRALFEPVEDRVELTWHYDALVSKLAERPRFEAEGEHLKSRQLWVASYFLKLLFSCDHRTPYAVSWFQQTAEMQAGLKRALPQFREGEVIERYASWALYWLWRSFWLSEDEVLAEVLPLCEAHRSPVVVDAAAVLRRLQGGSPALGCIEDVFAFRASFLAGLDPSSAQPGVKPLAELGLGDAVLQRLEERRRRKFEEWREEQEQKSAPHTLTLVGVAALVPALKVLREITPMGVVEAKKLAQALPSVVLAGVPLAVAEEAAARLLAVGATAEIVKEV